MKKKNLLQRMFSAGEWAKGPAGRDEFVHLREAVIELDNSPGGMGTRWDFKTVRVFNSNFEQIAIVVRKTTGEFSNHLYARLNINNIGRLKTHAG